MPETGIMDTMTDLLEQAFERVRTLPPETQDDLARVLLRLSGQDTQEIYHFSAEEHADLDAAEEEAARGDFATDEEIAAVLSRPRA